MWVIQAKKNLQLVARKILLLLFNFLNEANDVAQFLRESLKIYDGGLSIAGIGLC